MGLSRTQRIIELLESTDAPLSPSEISRILKIDEKDVLAVMEHIAFSIKRKGKKLVIIPERCKKCGFVFEPSTRMASKCPKCRSQWLEEPRFMIRKAD